MSIERVTTVDTGPRRVSRTVVVDAPAGELFAMMADPRRHTELDGFGTVKDAAVSAPSRLSQGAKFSVAMKQRGVPCSITSTRTLRPLLNVKDVVDAGAGTCIRGSTKSTT